jgi:predicted SnoaL-like aldol condensation-catalyzing enzyme
LTKEFVAQKIMNKKDIATTFLKLASSGKVREAYEKYVHQDFIHHNAYYKGDRETLLVGMEENVKQFPDKKIETLHALEDEKLVAVHSKVTLSPEKIFGVIHLFRFEDDKIIEEWEAGQEMQKTHRMRMEYFERLNNSPPTKIHFPTVKLST